MWSPHPPDWPMIALLPLIATKLHYGFSAGPPGKRPGYASDEEGTGRPRDKLEGLVRNWNDGPAEPLVISLRVHQATTFWFWHWVSEFNSGIDP
jgi:hypothetical protein